MDTLGGCIAPWINKYENDSWECDGPHAVGTDVLQNNILFTCLKFNVVGLYNVNMKIMCIKEEQNNYY